MPKEMLKLGIRERLEETAVTVKRFEAVTSSETLKASGEEVAFAAIGQIVGRVMAGGWFCGR
jgi:hypothetical protein